MYMCIIYVSMPLNHNDSKVVLLIFEVWSAFERCQIEKCVGSLIIYLKLFYRDDQVIVCHVKAVKNLLPWKEYQCVNWS